MIRNDPAAKLTREWQHNPDRPLRQHPREHWVDLFQTVGFITDGRATERGRPHEPLTMYRAATPDYARGLSWTTSRRFADAFRRLNCPRGAHLYTCRIQPEWTLARLSLLDMWDEYVVNLPDDAPLTLTR